MDNGLALERFDILDWKDVIDEVGQEIQKYLNDGGKVTAASDLKKSQSPFMQKVPLTLV